jgi:hypothetical protein
MVVPLLPLFMDTSDVSEVSLPASLPVCTFTGTVSPDYICTEDVWLNRHWLIHEMVD